MNFNVIRISYFHMYTLVNLTTLVGLNYKLRLIRCMRGAETNKKILGDLLKIYDIQTISN